MAKQLTLFDTTNSTETIYKYNGRNYKCVREAQSDLDFGRWTFEYKGKWHEVLNFKIRKELNKHAGLYKG